MTGFGLSNDERRGARASSPPRSGSPNGPANSRAAPRRSWLGQAEPGQPRPAYWAAQPGPGPRPHGALVRFRAVHADADPGGRRRGRGSRTSSIMSVMPPNPPPENGQPGSPASEPSARSSCAACRSARRASSGPRSTERAVSYSRWNRNQPRSSVPLSRGGGLCSVSAWGSRMPRSRGELDQRRMPHRAGEVQVQVRLGQGGHAACEGGCERRRSAQQLDTRVIPSTRSSSPSA